MSGKCLEGVWKESVCYEKGSGKYEKSQLKDRSSQGRISRTGHVRAGQVRQHQVRTGQVRPGQVKTVRAYQVRKG